MLPLPAGREASADVAARVYVRHRPELTRLTQTLAHRIGRYLERQGLLERDVENSYLAGEAMEAGPMEQLLGSSITYRIAVGPGAQAAIQPHPFPRGVCAEQQTPRAGDAGQAGQRRPASHDGGSAGADTGRPVWLSPSNPSPHSNGSYPKGSQATGWPDARSSRASGTGEGDWLGRACGTGADFGVLAGRRSFRYPWIIC